jgi:hypothetical protein
MESKGETCLPACFEFLTFNFFFVLLVFLLLRLTRKILKRCKTGKCLKAFSSFVYLAPMLLEGNLQYFLFLMFAQIQEAFSLNLKDKGFTVAGYFFYFLVLWLAVASVFLAYYMRRSFSKHILDNWRSRVYGLLTYSMTNVFRMLLFGALHALLRKDSAQLPILLGAEAAYVSFLILSMRHWHAHKVAFKVWFSVCFALLRMGLLLALLMQQMEGVVGS